MNTAGKEKSIFKAFEKMPEFIAAEMKQHIIKEAVDNMRSAIYAATGDEEVQMVVVAVAGGEAYVMAGGLDRGDMLPFVNDVITTATASDDQPDECPCQSCVTQRATEKAMH